MARMSADDRRDLLVEAAIRVIGRDGITAATTRSIVAEAGMALGVFHYCFRSKEELLEQVMVTINETSFEAVFPVLYGNESFEDIVRAGLKAYWAHVQEDPGRHQLTYELTQHALRIDPRMAEKQYAVYLENNRKFLIALADATNHTWLLPLDTVARYLLAVIEGVTLQWLVDHDSEAGLAVLLTHGDLIVQMAQKV